MHMYHTYAHVPHTRPVITFIVVYRRAMQEMMIYNWT